MTDTESPRSGGGQPPRAAARPLVRIIAGYLLMLLVAAIALFFIQRAGGSITAPPAAELAAVKSTGAAKADVFLHVLIALAAVIVTGLVLAKLFSFIGQPPVIGEVVAGIVLGPSLLGPEASALILPPAVAPYLGVIAQLGVLLYMFAVGLELHADMLRHRAHATVATSHASILLPFVLGAVIPHNSVVSRTFSKQLHSVVTVLLLPAFFAFTGMRTRIDLVSGSEQWLYCGLIIGVATGGKFIGTFVAGHLTGLGWRNAAALGALMNTRGLMELIVLNIGLDLGVISPTLFAMMVLMALATTMATAPAVHWLLRPDKARAA